MKKVNSAPPRQPVERGWRVSIASIPLIDELNNKTRFGLQRPDRQMTPGGPWPAQGTRSSNYPHLFHQAYLQPSPTHILQGRAISTTDDLHLRLDDRRREKERSRSHGTTLMSRSCSVPASVRVLAREVPRQATRPFG